MARTVHYQLVHASTASSPGAASLTIVNKGRIKGSYWRVAGIGGAGVSRYSEQLALNQTATTEAETNNPSRLVTVSAWSHSHANAGGVTGSSASGFLPCDIPVLPGDVLSINQVQAGTAAASQIVSAGVVVTEE